MPNVIIRRNASEDSVTFVMKGRQSKLDVAGINNKERERLIEVVLDWRARQFIGYPELASLRS